MATSKKVGKQAGTDLQNPKTPGVDRPPIASDLAQVPGKKAPVKKPGATKKPARPPIAKKPVTPKLQKPRSKK